MKDWKEIIRKERSFALSVILKHKIPEVKINERLS